jgi:FdhE protein
MTREDWLARHPYLQPVADLQAQIDAAVDGFSVPAASIPLWDEYGPDFHAGVPLLQSSKAGIDLSPVADLLLPLTRTLAALPLPAALVEPCRELEAQLRSEPDAPHLAMAGVLGTGSLPPAHQGLLHYLGWRLLVRSLRPVVRAFGGWRDEERWLRNYCPTCGSPPAMAQLVGKDPGRLRLLSCGCCRTRWRYRRTGCPFCENRDDHRLSVLDIEGEEGLRIDYCEACRGYLKTYGGEGNESVLLADWTSLHLDIVARDRGLKRLAGSLFEM